MPSEKKSIVEIILWGSFFFVATFGVFWNILELSTMSFIITSIAGFIFMWISYLYMNKWNYLYAIWSIGAAIILWSHIVWDNIALTNYYLAAICSYAVIHFAWSVYLQIKDHTSLKNLVLWSLSWALFLGFTVLSYSEFFDKSLSFSGILYTILASVYSIFAYILYKTKLWEDDTTSLVSRYASYSFLAIAISFLSIGVALIFSSYAYVTSLFCLFESAILLFFFHKIKDIKIAVAWLILMGLWVFKWYTNIWNVTDIYMYILPALIWSTILTWNTFQLQNSNKDIKNINNDIIYIHDTIHAAGVIWIIIGMMYGMSQTFSPAEVSMNLAFIVLSIVYIGLWYFYKKYGSNMQITFFITVYAITLMAHIILFVDYGHNEGLNIYTTLFQYIISSLFIIWWITFIHPLKNKTKYSLIIIAIIISYLFVITSYYIYNIFPNTFTLTIYWSIIAFFLISRWIKKDMISLRTLWLYLLSIVCLKVFFIDISTWISNPVIKVWAFIGVWILFIIIGTMYSRQYGNKLKWEFSLWNIFGAPSTWELNPESHTDTDKTQKSKSINAIIDEVDVSTIAWVKFIPNNGKAFFTKSKNLMKITLKIMWKKRQATFKPGELQDDYQYIVKNYTSSLNKTELSRVKSVMKDFVDTGWEVIIK